MKSLRGALQAGSLDPDLLLRERYLDRNARSAARSAYYRIKPLLPRRVQLAIRRAYAPLQRRRPFPAWPIESILVAHQHETFRRQLRESDTDRVPFVNFWPDRHRFCVILTHDVESPAGVSNIARVREVERRHGFVSSWNFVAEGYPIPAGLFGDLRQDGCEVGLHGIRHDDSLFRSRRSFENQLPQIKSYLERWDAVGFRSPATHRNAEWMHELPCLYDSSFPDTDPFEPMPGGCCSIFPFQFGSVVELPITLPQDHTLFDILRAPSIAVWRQKSEWIIDNHGLLNLITHPDYMLDPARLARYEEFLRFLGTRPDGWHDLPRNVARWWRDRRRLAPEILPNEGWRPSLAYAREGPGGIAFELDAPAAIRPAAT